MKILFIADKFEDEPRDDVSNFPGGAELTDAALIESCPWEIKKVKNRDLLPEMLKDFDVHIIGNFKSRNKNIIRKLNELGRHILFEHDMRICRYDGDFTRARKEPVHYYTHRCICPHLILQKLYRSGLGTIFLTNRQLSIYKRNPFFKVKNLEILGSSAMNYLFFNRVDDFKKKKNIIKNGTAVFYSPHRLKGYLKSLSYCEQKGIEPFEIRDMSPEEVLDIFERSEQFVFLPEGPEGAGRMPVEARFLGCNVVINDNVGVAGESWWDLSDDLAYGILKDTPARFWRIVEKLVNENSD